MTVTTELFPVLTFVVLTVSRCGAEYLPPPTNLSYRWLDAFNVNVSWSWERPEQLGDCAIQYIFCLEQSPGQPQWRRTSRYYVESLLTETTDSDHWMYTVRAVCSNAYPSLESTKANGTVRSERPRVELVKDFKCFVQTDGLNCSWIPVNRSLDLTFSYRFCGSNYANGNLRACDEPHGGGGGGGRSGCRLKDPTIGICVLFNATIGWSILKPKYVLHPPTLRIKQDSDQLVVTCSRPEVGRNCDWIYTFSYTECDKTENVSLKFAHNFNTTYTIPYKDCLYKFRCSLSTDVTCPEMGSDWSDFVTHDARKPGEWTLPLAAIIVSVLVFTCVLLSCYCFRKHSDIICPNTPDPSVIFKDIVMNGNREHKAENLYSPMPEAIEPCKVTLINQSGGPQTNS